MNVSEQVSKHLREVFFGGNWTWSDVKGQLADVTWQEAISKVQDLNTIATLTYHISYFVRVQLKVLKGGPLEGKDSESFAHPPINNEEDWLNFRLGIWSDVESLAKAIEGLSENELGEVFVDEKYGIYYRNLHGLIEHTHYHLGQIVLLKKLLKDKPERA